MCRWSSWNDGGWVDEDELEVEFLRSFWRQHGVGFATIKNIVVPPAVVNQKEAAMLPSGVISATALWSIQDPARMRPFGPRRDGRLFSSCNI